MSKNGKEIKLRSIMSRIMIDMVDNYEHAMLYKTDMNTDIDRFIELDEKLWTNCHLGMYKEFEDIIEDVWELLAIYARISAYKELEIVKELPDTSVDILGHRLLDKIDYVLCETYVKESEVYLPYLFEFIYDVFSFYTVKFKLDNKGDIVRGYTGETGRLEKKYVIKRFYIC